MLDDPNVPALSAAALRLLRADEPSQRELDAAYRRHVARARARAPRWIVARWVAAGLALGFGVAFAAEAVQQSQSATQNVTPPSPRAPKVPRKTGLNALTTPNSVAFSEPPAQPMTASTQGVASSAAAPRAPLPDKPVEPGSENGVAWAKAAEGLRKNDIAETQSALAILESSGSDSDREAARLVRAQLMLHQGNSSAALPLLSELATSAKSPLVRAKARAVFDQASSTNSPLGAGRDGN